MMNEGRASRVLLLPRVSTAINALGDASCLKMFFNLGIGLLEKPIAERVLLGITMGNEKGNVRGWSKAEDI